MKILGHHVAVPAIFLALADGMLFLLALYAFGLTGSCQSCYLKSIAHFEPLEAVLLAVAFVAMAAAIGLYNRDAFVNFRVFFARFILASQFVLIPTVVFVGLVKATTDAPFGWFVGILTLSIALFFLVLFLVRVIIQWGLDLSYMKNHVLVLGEGPEADRIIDFINGDGSGHAKCVGQLKKNRFSSDGAITIGNVALKPMPNPLDTPLAALAKSLKAEEIVVAELDEDDESSIWQILECKLQGIQVTDYLSFWSRETGELDLERIGPRWLLMNEGFRTSWSRRFVKRALDVVMSLIFLTVTLPICLIAAVLISLDGKGHVFYKQERVGKNGKIFSIWKFRSMRVDAEADGVPQWTAANDNRITPVGRFLRKTRIDEFPQVVNVLLGHMSFIGPRPERPYFVDDLKSSIPFYDLRHRIQPGITGWAQINYHYGASIEDAKKKLAYDLYYVKNQDIILDFVILFQTVRVFLFLDGSR